MRTLFGLFFNFYSEGKENVPREGPALLASNHQSYLDPIIVAIGQDYPVTFMAWHALFSVRWFAWLIRRFGAFPVNLDRRADTGSYKMALRVLRAGMRLVIYPEAGRSPDGGLMPMRPGVARLAMQSGAPIVPVRIEGAWAAWPKPRRLPKAFKPIHVTYGPPIYPPKDLKSDEERAQAAEEIMRKLHDFMAINIGDAAPDSKINL